MRQGSNAKRMRGRGNGRKNSNPRSQTYESNGPEVKVRGNAQQVVEKYLALARDASSIGDRVAAESYFQHAEHYYRLMTANGGGDQKSPYQQQPGNSDEMPQSGVDSEKVSAATSELTNGEAKPASGDSPANDPASAPQPEIGGTDSARPE